MLNATRNERGAYGILPVAYAPDAQSIDVQSLASEVNKLLLDDRRKATRFAFDDVNSVSIKTREITKAVRDTTRGVHAFSRIPGPS